MEIIDRRTQRDRVTHPVLIVVNDAFMTRLRGSSEPDVCAWACRPEHEELVMSWLDRRKELKRLRVRHANYRPKRACHYSIYVVHDQHPALCGRSL